MAAPAVFACPADTWVKVAINVTVGVIRKVSVAPNVYLQTFRLTTGTAPTDNSDAVLIFGESIISEIKNTAGIDVYVKAVGAAGEVRVDV